MTRGIQNVSGVSCHISCALQILLHALTPICEALTKKENGPHPSRTISQLAEFAKELTEPTSNNDDNSPPVDPSSLYKMLKEFRSSSKSTVSLEPEDVGDASTAILKLLQILKQQSKDWSSLVDICTMGTMRHSIKGTCQIESSSTIRKRIRVKPGKTKQMPFPFPLSGKYQSLDEAVQIALQPTEVVGYQWDLQNPDTYKETCYDEAGQVMEHQGQTHVDPDNDGRNDNDITGAWITEKALHIEELPHYCFFHLDRFSYDTMGDKTCVNPHVDIPLSLDRSPLQPNAIGSLQLLGGILHVSDGGRIEEEGHYVTLLRMEENSWILVDDDKCSEIQSDQEALDRLKGTTDEAGNFLCATLVAFGPSPESTAITGTGGYSSSLHEIVSRIIRQTPEDLIGQRVLVKWAKAKFYAGVVKSYNPETEMHSILYDDGDVKEYVMSSKTVEYQ